VVCGIWTTAFVIKVTASFMGLDVISVNSNTTSDEQKDFKSAVILALYSIVTELIPLYVVIEPRFVKIFTMNFLLMQQADTDE